MTNPLEVVKNPKLLGLTISDNLLWNTHVNEVVKKLSKKLHFLVQRKRAWLPPSYLVLFYKSCIRSAVDYTVPVFYNALPQYMYLKKWDRAYRERGTVKNFSLYGLLIYYFKLCHDYDKF